LRSQQDAVAAVRRQIVAAKAIELVIHNCCRENAKFCDSTKK